MSDFYFIYIDDYGDSSGNLNDPKQPIFSLTATFVKAENWINVEMELLEIIEEFSEKYGIELQRLHAVEIYQRSGSFRKVDTGELLAIFEKILLIFKKYEISFISALTEKASLRQILDNAISLTKSTNQNTNFLEESLSDGKFVVSSYIHAFSEMLPMIDLHLANLNAYGVLIFDQQDEFKDLESTPLHKAARALDGAGRILENPFFRDSRVQTLLCIPDFIGYVIGGVKFDQLKERERPKLKEWLEILKPLQANYNMRSSPELILKTVVTYTIFAVFSMPEIKTVIKNPLPISQLKGLVAQYLLDAGKKE
jgi:hypothetical protein